MGVAVGSGVGVSVGAGVAVSSGVGVGVGTGVAVGTVGVWDKVVEPVPFGSGISD